MAGLYKRTDLQTYSPTHTVSTYKLQHYKNKITTQYNKQDKKETMYRNVRKDIGTRPNEDFINCKMMHCIEFQRIGLFTKKDELMVDVTGG